MENLKERVTIYEVARASGVSLATVSRVINGQGNVTEKTRQKVQETIKRLNYKPSGLAQALATNKSTTIGIVVPSANYVYISNVLNGICEVAKDKGFNISLFTTSHSKNEALHTVDKVITSHVDGAIIFDDELEVEDIEKINSFSVPTVVINNRVEGEKVGCVVFGYEHNLRKIIARKLENDANLVPTFLHVYDCGRLLARTEKAFIETCVEHGRDYSVVNIDDSYDHTYSEFLNYFQNHKSGYFVAYRDSTAAAIVNAATDSGLKVPEDVEVLSLIGTRYAKYIRPALTSMTIDLQEVGRRSMYMLMDLNHNELLQKTCRIEAVYEKRSSTKE